MDDLEKKLKDSFGALHAGPALKASALANIRQARKPRSWMKAVAAAAVMLVLFVGGYGTRMFLEPVNVISIDINPSIELGINAFDRVVTTQAYNPEGERLLQSLDLRFRKWEQAVDAVMDSDTVLYLLDREETLTFTTVARSEEESESLWQQLRDHTAGKAECYHTDSQAVAQAHVCGLSYGKYLAYLDAVEAGEDLTVEEARHMTMKQIRQCCGHYGENNANPTEPITVPSAEETTLPTEQSHGHSGKRHRNGHH